LKANAEEEAKMNKVDLLEVYLNACRVGRIALTPEGLCAFEYDSEWLNREYALSPFYLPLKSGLMIAKRDPFRGNFGVFDDSLPDGWGNLLFDHFLQEKGINPYKLTILERLSLIGSTGRGALEYRPDRSIVTVEELLDFDKLALESQKLLSTSIATDSLDMLYRYGGSSGGARPKVFATIDSKEWLVKFKASTDPEDVGETEYKYALLAKACGIKMPETKLFNGKYFGVERFDRTANGKVHTVSAAGLLHADYRIPSLDYALLLKLTLQLTKDIEQVADMFRLMVFNVVISNRDDHAKNFSFQYIGGSWRLSPAYDLLPGNGFNGYHTTTFNGKGEPTRADIFALATEVGLQKQRAENIFDEITTKCNERKMAKFNMR
jgi:serine/threonine-protein kinase HipA